MRTRTLFSRATGAAALLAMSQTWAASPDALNVTVYKTEICSDSGCTAILDESSGISADLVNSDTLFGEASAIPAGDYDRFRFTLANQATFDGTNSSCTGTTTASGQSFTIDETQDATANITVSFATANASTPGSSSWYANGSDSNPFLMDAPITVEDGATTGVSLQFNTAETLTCDSSGNIAIEPPTFSVGSNVEADSTAFTGGEYWVMGQNVHGPGLSAETNYAAGDIIDGEYPSGSVSTGEYLPPFVSSSGVAAYELLLNDPTHGPAYRAQMRAETAREVRWGMKARFTPPDATGAGTVELIRDTGKHRHSAIVGRDEFANAPTSDSATVIDTWEYQLGSDNHVTLTGTPGKSSRGAFTPDYETFLLAHLADGAGVTMGVKVATGKTSFDSGLYAWNGRYLEIERDDSPTTCSSADGAGENGDECVWMGFTSDVAWFDVGATNWSMDTIQNRETITNPEATSPSFTSSRDDLANSNTRSALGLDSLSDGAGIIGPNSETWVAQAPSGNMTIMASNTTDYDSDHTSGDVYRHFLGYRMLPSLSTTGSAVGTHTRSSLADTYYLSGMWQDYDASGDDIRFGASGGDLVFNADGTGSLSNKEVNNYREVTSLNSDFLWDIATFCLGTEDPDGDGVFERFDPRDPAHLDSCAPEGRLIDVVKVVDTSYTGTIADAPRSATKAIMFIGQDEHVLTYFSPHHLSAPGNGQSLGNAVRLD